MSLDWIRRNPSQAIGFFFSLVSLVIIPAVAAIREEAVILGAPTRLFVVLGAVLLAVTIIGRVWQALRGSVPVSWGWSSTVGFLAALVAEVMGVLTELGDALEPLGIPPGFWYTTGVFLAAVTKLLRYAQAVDPFRDGGPVIIEETPTEGGDGEPTVPGELPPPGTDVPASA